MVNNDLSRISGTVSANHEDSTRTPHPPYRRDTHSPAFLAPPQLLDPSTTSDPPHHSGLVPWSSNPAVVPSTFLTQRNEARHATFSYSTHPGDPGGFTDANRPAPHFPVAQPTSFPDFGTLDQSPGYGIDPRAASGFPVFSGDTDFLNQPYHDLSVGASLGAPFPTAAFAPSLGTNVTLGVPSPLNLSAIPSTYAPYGQGTSDGPGSLPLGTGYEIPTASPTLQPPHTFPHTEAMPTRKRSSTAIEPPASRPAVPTPKRRRRTSGGSGSGAAARSSRSDPAAAEAESDNESDIIDLRDLSKVPELLLQRQREKAERIKLGTFQCAICMDYATSVTVTHCGHLFCVECLTTALDTEAQRHKCPICRQKIENKPRQAYKSNTKGFWPLELKLMTARKGGEEKTADG